MEKFLSLIKAIDKEDIIFVIQCLVCAGVFWLLAFVSCWLGGM